MRLSDCQVYVSPSAIQTLILMSRRVSSSFELFRHHLLSLKDIKAEDPHHLKVQKSVIIEFKEHSFALISLFCEAKD